MTVPTTIALLAASLAPLSLSWNDFVVPKNEKPSHELRVAQPHPRSDAIQFDAPPHSESIRFRR